MDCPGAILRGRPFAPTLHQANNDRIPSPRPLIPDTRLPHGIEARRFCTVHALIFAGFGAPGLSKPKLEWAEKADVEDLDAATRYLSLLTSDAKARALVKSLRNAKVVEHAAKDLLRAANLPLLPNTELQVEADLKRIEKGKPLPPVLLIRGDLSRGFPLTVADGYHRICAVCYFDENAPVACQIVDIADGQP